MQLPSMALFTGAIDGGWVGLHGIVGVAPGSPMVLSQ
jgi:hypothetical protein